jgi:hypothetical protein
MLSRRFTKILKITTETKIGSMLHNSRPGIPGQTGASAWAVCVLWEGILMISRFLTTGQVIVRLDAEFEARVRKLEKGAKGLQPVKASSVADGPSDGGSIKLSLIF